ncbi:Tyrosine-protein phosphatase non-receptor type 1 [Mortierella sp. GBA30]|nr:Tyrosine-protein phosphatase non-receptor type 1 [Mortierella sp. GBA30]
MTANSPYLLYPPDSDILPYKHSQVTVHHASEQQQPQLGYINANRITAPPTLLSSLPKDWPGYIATQAPLPHTQARFWKMVEQQNVQVIVCLTVVSQDRTRRAQKAERYWPLAGEIDELEKDLCVRNLGVLESQNDTEYHHFEMWNPQCGAETQRRRILLVHYQGWPDHGVPQRTEHLRDMLFRIRAWKAEQQQQRGRQQGAGFGPMVVHCSAGCGRTGTFCVVDTILSVLEYTKYPYLAPPPSIRYVRPDAAHIGEAAEARVQSGAEENQGRFSDVYDWQSDRDIIQETLSSFRQERMLMVQTADQYSFCYKAVRDLCC